MTRAVEAIVVGAGVSGLTTAIRLAEAGTTVRVVAAEPPQHTTSAVAGALWGLYLVPDDPRMQAWGRRTLDALRVLADDPATGVRLATGREAFRTPEQPAAWTSSLDGFRACDAGELPAGFTAGWCYRTALVTMGRYLDYLRQRLAEAGVEVESGQVDSLAEAARVEAVAGSGDTPVVVNCAGIGASRLAADRDLHPVRGQIVLVENPGLTEFFVSAEPDLTYFFPHDDIVLLGGTAQPGQWSREPDPATAAAIVERCASVEPRLRGARIVGHRVGLRPARSQVRLESETVDGVRVVHNYGHGGAGISLSWGCAEEAAALVKQLR